MKLHFTKFKTSLCLSIYFISISFLPAQQYYTIGNGTNMNGNYGYPAPYGNYYYGAKHQFLILASELNTAGANSGYVKSIAFNVGRVSGSQLNDFRIKIRNTTLSSLNSSMDSSGLTTVWGPQNYTESNGWNTHTFSNGFYWDGTSNLKIEVCFFSNNSNTNAGTYYSNTGFNSSAYFASYSNTVCSSTLSANTSFSRPNIKIGILSNIPPITEFYAKPDYSCDGKIEFEDATQFMPTSWKWNFGDTYTSTLQNPQHTYSTNGVYTVTLIASNSYGTDTLEKKNYVTVSSTGGPIAASCTSSTTTYCCNYGIYRVLFNTIDNSSSDASEGYKNFTCYGTTLTEGKIYPIEIETGPDEPQDTKVWIDFNNNGIFTNTELVFSENNTFNPMGSITIPDNAVLNTALRMRVSSDEVGTNFSFCSQLTSGQSEDYTVRIVANTLPPVVGFKTDDSLSCDGVIGFTDLSQNLPTTWLWRFGDGQTSTIKNPTHTYSSTGKYTVTLIISNSYGSDSLQKTDYIKVVSTSGGPQAATCKPTVQYVDTTFGINSVTLNTIQSTTGGGAEYIDYSCQQQTSLTMGVPYQITIQTNSFYQTNLRVWIDYNNDRSFTQANELALTSDNLYQLHQGYITPPTGALKNTPLRMRIGLTRYYIPGACTTSYYGEYEDYGIKILENTFPPDADFVSDNVQTCTGKVQFRDSTLNIPTAWKWYFGDGTTDTAQNPMHVYTSLGTFSVKLVVSNSYGSDSILKNSYIKVTGLDGPLPAKCKSVALNPTSMYGIQKVILNTIDNSSMTYDAYTDYSCTQMTELTAGAYYSLEIETNNQYAESAAGWIDYNNDALFDSTERIFLSESKVMQHQVNFLVSGSATLNQWLRLRISSDYYAFNLVDGCSDIQYGEVEDYAVKIKENTNPPIADFTSDVNFSCVGKVQFIDSSQNVPNSWLWDFGDGTTSTLKNPIHSYLNNGNFTVILKSCNTFGCDTAKKIGFITVKLNSVPRAASCSTSVSSTYLNYGITNLTFNTINNTSAMGEKYKDFSCSQQTEININYPYRITITTGSTSQQNVNVWIDFNDNGSFQTSELVFETTNLFVTHTGIISAPTGTVLNKPLRMRVATERYSSPQVCSVYYGEGEDYAVTVLPNLLPPKILFSVNNRRTCDGAVAFTDSSYNTPTSWLWNFGDGTTSTLKNPQHSYTQEGNYTVRLTSCNTYGCDSLIKYDYIEVAFAQKPKTALCLPKVQNPYVYYSIYSFKFNTLEYNSIGNEGYSDNTCYNTVVVSGQSYPIKITTSATSSTGARIWIDLNNSGDFTTGEQVFTSSYQTGFHSGTITIPSSAVKNQPLRIRVAVGQGGGNMQYCDSTGYNEFEDYTLIVVPQNTPPIANFTYEYTDPCNGLFKFSDNSSVNPNKWYWDFGDQLGLSTLQNPYYTYTKSGTYTVTMIVSNSYGKDTLTKQLTVNLISADFTMRDTVSAGDIVSFINTSLNATSWSWDFGDGTTSVLKDPTHMYSNIGIYKVTLLATNSQFCIAQTSKYLVTVGPATSSPIANFIFEYPDQCQGLVKFTDRSLSNPNKWFWNFGDQIGLSTLENPYYTYTKSGNYTVSLTISNSIGKDSIFRQITIDIIAADFKTKDTVSKGAMISFLNTSGIATTWFWDFGDGTTSTLKDPTHSYSDVGVYKIKLLATNSIGCISQVYKYIVVINSVGIEDLLEDGYISLHPIPSEGTLFLMTDSQRPHKLDFKLYNLTGSLVFEQIITLNNGNTTKIDLNKIDKGIYFAKITENGNQVIRKIILQ